MIEHKSIFKLNVRRVSDFFITRAVQSYGFALLARKKELTYGFFEDLRDLDYTGGR